MTIAAPLPNPTLNPASQSLPTDHKGFEIFEIWNVDRKTLEDLHLVVSDQSPVGAAGREIVTGEPGLSARVYDFSAGAADDAECAAAQLGFNVRMMQNSSKTLEPVVIFQQRQGSSLENLRLAVGSP